MTRPTFVVGTGQDAYPSEAQVGDLVLAVSTYADGAGPAGWTQIVQHESTPIGGDRKCWIGYRIDDGTTPGDTMTGYQVWRNAAVPVSHSGYGDKTNSYNIDRLSCAEDSAFTWFFLSEKGGHEGLLPTTSDDGDAYTVAWDDANDASMYLFATDAGRPVGELRASSFGSESNSANAQCVVEVVHSSGPTTMSNASRLKAYVAALHGSHASNTRSCQYPGPSIPLGTVVLAFTTYGGVDPGSPIEDDFTEIGKDQNGGTGVWCGQRIHDGTEATDYNQAIGFIAIGGEEYSGACTVSGKSGGSGVPSYTLPTCTTEAFVTFVAWFMNTEKDSNTFNDTTIAAGWNTYFPEFAATRWCMGWRATEPLTEYGGETFGFSGFSEYGGVMVGVAPRPDGWFVGRHIR